MNPTARYETLLAALRRYLDAPPCACAECAEEERDRHAEVPSSLDWDRLVQEIADSMDDEGLTAAALNERARLSHEAYRIAGCVLNGEWEQI